MSCAGANKCHFEQKYGPTFLTFLPFLRSASVVKYFHLLIFLPFYIESYLYTLPAHARKCQSSVRDVKNVHLLRELFMYEARDFPPT